MLHSSAYNFIISTFLSSLVTAIQPQPHLLFFSSGMTFLLPLAVKKYIYTFMHNSDDDLRKIFHIVANIIIGKLSKCSVNVDSHILMLIVQQCIIQLYYSIVLRQ